MHPLIKFWQNCYGAFAYSLAEGVGFSVPGFSDPLMSPRFVTGKLELFLRDGGEYFNWIGPAMESPSHYRKQVEFFVGVADTHLATSSAPVIPLRQALLRKDFWQLLEEGFPRDLTFLRVLLPYLARRPNADFQTVLLQEKGNTKAVITVGVSGGVALAMNAVVAKGERGKGLSQALAYEARVQAGKLGAKEIVFWSELEFLQRHARRVDSYAVYVAEGDGAGSLPKGIARSSLSARLPLPSGCGLAAFPFPKASS